ncbi:RNA-directed DNA polymerase [Bacillus mycoides]|nr:RNA-directed DNA polymerase [Bacillus mycoides]
MKELGLFCSIKSYNCSFLGTIEIVPFLFRRIFTNMNSDALYNLSQQMDTKYPIITDVLRNKKHHYNQLDAKKRNGKIRKLYSPSKILKYYQKWIATEILSKTMIHECCTAYQKGISLNENLIPHQKHMYFLCVDIEDFFQSINFKRILHLFKKLTNDTQMAYSLSELCTLHKTLPQGAVTSPVLSNAVNYRLDKRIHGYAKKHGLVYTRYADDITISGNDMGAIKSAYYTVKCIIESEGYKFNKEKTRILKPGVKRKVTGLLINEEQEIRIGREKYRELRSMIYTYKNSRAITGVEKEHLFLRIKGWISYLKHVDFKTCKMLLEYINKIYVNDEKNPFSFLDKRSDEMGYIIPQLQQLESNMNFLTSENTHVNLVIKN